MTRIKIIISQAVKVTRSSFTCYCIYVLVSSNLG